MNLSNLTSVEGMKQRVSLDEAGKIFGVSANAMRARAKKNPEKYQTERDNSGKIWLWLDPKSVLHPHKKKSYFEGLKKDFEPSKELEKLAYKSNFEMENLKKEIELERQLRQAAEVDRDRWRAIVEKFADRPRRRWWPWGRL